MPEIKAFNSEEYGFSDIQIVMLGRPIVGLRGIKIKEMQEKKNVHGAGRKPIARSRGPINYEGSVKMLLSEVHALLQSQGQNGSIVGIQPFDIPVVFAPRVTDVITTHVCEYVEFTECEININQGDTEVEVELPIIIGNVKWNV
jgi:hypothetical protein